MGNLVSRWTHILKASRNSCQPGRSRTRCGFLQHHWLSPAHCNESVNADTPKTAITTLLAVLLANVASRMALSVNRHLINVEPVSRCCPVVFLDIGGDCLRGKFSSPCRYFQGMCARINSQRMSDVLSGAGSYIISWWGQSDPEAGAVLLARAGVAVHQIMW